MLDRRTPETYIVSMTRGQGHEAQKGTDTMTKNTPVAEICLYGTRQTGAGYIVSIQTPGAVVPTVRIGTGDPVQGRSFTEAVWIACETIQLATGLVRGIVHVYEPSGHKYAAFDLGHVPTFGNMTWIDGGTVYVIPADAVLEAAAL